MIDPAQIPPKVERAVTDLVLAGGFRLTPEEARAAIAAAIAAWPGVNQISGDRTITTSIPFIILPLPQEARDG